MQFAFSRRVMLCAQLVRRVLLALGVGLCALSPAAATTFVRMDERDLAARATVAVIGTVRAVSRSTATASIATRVVIEPERVLVGELPAGSLVLDEPGGRTAGGVAERIFGAPAYRVGERVLVFATRHADATWRTTAMAMGKYELEDGDLATRVFDEEVTVIDPESGTVSAGPIVERSRLADVLASVRASKPAPSLTLPRDQKWSRGRERIAQPPFPPSEFPPPQPFLAAGEGREGAAENFTYLGSPSRWFEPDDGVPVFFRIDPRGAGGLGAIVSVGAAIDALAAWTNAGTSLLLGDDTLTAVERFAGCAGDNRIVFNDPFNEIEAPVDCRGVLGIGGYCYSEDRRVVNGTEFNRIRLGKVTLADGFAGCALWTPCNLAQILTHELGHAIGLGHSTDPGSTMTATARFDGRCAGLGGDDLAGARFIYPPPPTATPSPTPSFTSLPSSTPTATHTPTVPPTPPGGTPYPAPYRVSGRIAYYSNDVAVPAAQVDLSGALRQHVTTTANGLYAFSNAPDGALLVRPSKVGDTGAALSALDAALVLQASAGLRAMTPDQELACDVTGNGAVSPLDAARILQRVVGLVTGFPAAQTCGTDWLFVPAAAPVANLEVVAPFLSADTCRAGGLSYSPLQSDAAGQNFRAALLGDCTGNWLPSTDARAAEPRLAPRGTALTTEPLRHVRGVRWRMAAGVRGPVDMRSLDLELRYDADRLTPMHVRAVRLANAALVDHHVPTPGRLIIALASAVPFPADGRAIVVIDFDSRIRDVPSRLVRPYAIAVDERLVPTPER